jgi:hypothetical protein
VTHVQARVSDVDAWVDRFEEVGVNVAKRPKGVQITLEPSDIESDRDLIGEFLRHAAEEGQA